jgi:topoisomerase-4 subunit A
MRIAVSAPRTTRASLEKVRRRIHLLEDRMIVYLDVNEGLKTIRESDDPKADLMRRFELTDAQAEDILEMPLRALARLARGDTGPR